jgi:nucleoside-diphosphate-sugar epimerase
MKVLLTGASGFIGSHVARLLAQRGHDVHAPVRPHSSLRRIDDIAPSLTVFPSDLRALGQADGPLDRIRPEVCIHLAWYAEPGKYLGSMANVRVLRDSVQLAARLAESGCRKFVAAGTCLEYDTSLGYLSETSRTAPQSPYAATKLALYHTLEAIRGAGVMEFAWLRLFHMYGPWEDNRRLAPFVISSLLRNEVAEVTLGSQVRDFLHVRDVAAAVVTVAEADVSGPVNVGSGEPVTVRDVITAVGALLHAQDRVAFGAVEPRAGDPKFICANNGKLVTNTDWAPSFSLREGLQDTVEWWRRQFDT